LVNVELVGQGISQRSRVLELLRDETMKKLGNHGARTASERGSRSAYFGPELGRLDAQIIDRGDLPGGCAVSRQGPFIVEEYDATCLVPPGAKARLDGYGNIMIEL
jgi:N-methylhydantoinase A